MKKLFILIITAGLTAVAAPTFSQRSFVLSNTDRLGFLNITMGVAYPVGSPFKSDATQPESLMPLRGKSLQISVGYRLNHRFGVMASVSNCINPADASTMISNAQNGGLGKNFKASIDDWNCAFVTAGPYVSYTAGLFVFDGRIMGGYSFVQKPSTVLQGDYFDLPASLETSVGTSKTFTMGLGTTLRLKLGRNFAFNLSGDYLTTKAKFNNTTTLSIDQDKITNTSQETKGLGSLNLSGGISLMF